MTDLRTRNREEVDAVVNSMIQCINRQRIAGLH